MTSGRGGHGPRWHEGYQLGLRDRLTDGLTLICDDGPETLDMVDGYWAGRQAGLQQHEAAPETGLAMTAHKDGLAVDWGAVTDPILATLPWRPKPPRRLQVMAGTAADPHEHDWAGPSFTKPGPEPDVGYWTGYASGKAEAIEGMTSVADPPLGGLDEVGADCARLQRSVHSQLPQDTSALARTGARLG
jgi:hypothetical protein